MRYLLSIIIALCCSSAWAFPPGFIAAVTHNGGGSTGDVSLFGFSTLQTGLLANNNSYQYLFKIPTTVTGGTLTKYKITVIDGIASLSQMNLCLYTHNSGTDRPNALVSNSCVTSSVLMSFPQTLELSVTGGPTLSEGGQYWIGTQPIASAVTAGNTSSGNYYLYYSSGTQSATLGPAADAAYTGTPGILQIEVTP